MKNVETIEQNHTFKEAATLMAKKGIGCLVITDSDGVSGIVTERDVLKQVAKDSSALDRPVKDVMSADVITIESDKHIDDAAALMSEKKIKKLPVVDDGQLVGIITSTDLIANCSDFNDFSLFE
ncbi:CBS domain-containing protein [Candidatus Woesearchaeota archaeon]|nr:CBS domain-containing protein [Candidatus Woesearchaeota archaeon]